MITNEEAQILLALIDRVQLSGKEARTVAHIQMKLESLLKVKNKPAEKVEKKK
jgi:hypothetical protein